MPGPIRILIVDDHDVVRYALRTMLQHEEVIIVGEAGDGYDAIRLVQQFRPDVILMDITMPRMNGIEAIKRILKCCAATKILVISMHTTIEHVSRALEAGAKGYILKTKCRHEMLRAVCAVHAGETYLSPELGGLDRFDIQHVPQNPLDRLSSRECEVMQLVVEGKSSSEIAQTLRLSRKTVETYRSRLMCKLGVSNLTGLVRFAVVHGLTPVE